MADDPSQPRGAVYIPARAYNAYQMWRNYDREMVERDLGLAESLKLNALRLWLSYERWLEDRAGVEESFKHLLATAHYFGLRVMPSLFECCGIEPTEQARNDIDPRTAVCVRSPSKDLVSDERKWDGPREYVTWFMKTFAGDHRVLAVEIINEPRGDAEIKFTRAMFQTAAKDRGEALLTFGALNFEDRRLVQDLGLGIVQMHENFPASEAVFRRRMQLAADTQQKLSRPVWVTEWQRLRPGGSGFGDEPVKGDEWQPAYATLAEILRAYPLGSFFWSLMLRPAYLPIQRKKGTLNGVFHEDGAVWSLADARAISGDATFEAPERREWPNWCKAAADLRPSGDK